MFIIYLMDIFLINKGLLKVLSLTPCDCCDSCDCLDGGRNGAVA